MAENNLTPVFQQKSVAAFGRTVKNVKASSTKGQKINSVVKSNAATGKTKGIIIDSVISSEPLTDVEESSSTTNEEASSSTGDELADIIDSATDSDESVDKPVKTNINEIINDNENTDVENESTVIIKVKTVAIQENCSDIDNIEINDKCKARFMIDENSSSNISNSNARVAADKMQSYKSLPISIRKFRAQNIPVENVLPSASSSSITPPADDESNTETVAAILLTLLYLFTVLFSWYYAVSNSTISEKANSVSQSPWIGQHNATKLIDQRLLLIQDRYEKVLGSDKWKLLRMSPNVTIETLSSEDGSWPLYIRTCAIFYAQPIDILKHLGWLQFDETQRKIDRFHESSHLLFAPSHKSKVIRKTTKRPLIFPKREMTVALCEKISKRSFVLNNLKLRTAPMQTFTSITIPKGTLMNAMVNVNIDLDALEAPEKRFSLHNIFNRISPKDKIESDERSKERQRQRDRKERHIKAYQDMMGWFVPLESGGTLLVFVMQVDLGPDIPHWAFLTAVAATAAWGMDTLNKLSNER